MPGTMISLTVNNRPVQAYLSLPEMNLAPGVLVLHAWWGLKPFFQQFCDRLAGEGFAVLAPDLRDGKIATTIEEAKALMEQSDNQWAGEIIMTAKDTLRAHPAVQGSEIGVIGFSMGAAWAMITAAYAPDQVGAAVLYYGAAEADFRKVRARVLGHYSPNDEWEPIEYVQGMEAEMKAAGLDVTLYTYPGTAHWFVEEDRPEYNAEAAALAWQRTIAFLKANL